MTCMHTEIELYTTHSLFSKKVGFECETKKSFFIHPDIFMYKNQACQY